MVLNSLDYGLPQARKRLYIVAIPMDHPLLAMPPEAALVDQLQQNVLALKLSMVPLSALLLPDGDPSLAAELARLEQVKANSLNRQEKETASWREEHQRFCHGEGFLWGQIRPTRTLEQSLWFQACPPREKDIIVLKLNENPNIKFVDSSQNISRCRASQAEYCNTVTPQW